MATQHEKKPLYDAETSESQVVSMETTEDGQYLVAAYGNGLLILWSLQKYAKAYTIGKLNSPLDATF